MHIYCSFISQMHIAAKAADLRPAGGWKDWTCIDVLSVNGTGRWVLWLCLNHFTTSQKCCCPGINGLRRMRTVVEEAAISYKRTEEPLKCVLIHSCTLWRQRCQTYWWSCLWMTVINVSQQPLAAWFYLEHHKRALSANICRMGGWPEWDSIPWGFSDASLHVPGILLLHYSDIWQTWLYLLCRHTVWITLMLYCDMLWYKPLLHCRRCWQFNKTVMFLFKIVSDV